MVMGDSGIFSKANTAKEQTNIADETENVKGIIKEEVDSWKEYYEKGKDFRQKVKEKIKNWRKNKKEKNIKKYEMKSFWEQ